MNAQNAFGKGGRRRVAASSCSLSHSRHIHACARSSLRISCFRQRDFLGTPVNLLLSSQKCQGVLFPQSVNNHDFCSGPMSVDLICPQPSQFSQPWSLPANRQSGSLNVPPYANSGETRPRASGKGAQGTLTTLHIATCMPCSLYIDVLAPSKVDSVPFPSSFESNQV